ncbi:MAG: hypothetical protein Q9209_006399 [Squamulea sp. 1 TL-2023]
MLKEANGQSFRKWQREYANDGIIKFLDVLNSATLLILSPKALSEVTAQKTYDFIKPPQLKGTLGKILGVGLFLAEGDEHKKQRKDLSPAFAFRPVKQLYPIFWEKAGELVAMLSQHSKEGNPSEKLTKPIDVNDWTSRVTLDIIGVAGFGHDFDSIHNPASDLIQTYRKIFSRSKIQQVIVFLNRVFPRWLVASIPIRRNNDIEAASKDIKGTCHDLVQQAKQKLFEKENSTPAKDILSVALSSSHFSDSDLVNQLMTFLLAGHETTASALSWAICMLCTHPNTQIRLRDELCSANLPDPRSSNSSIAASQIDHLPYLNAFCNEVLRLYPPIPATVRVATCDTSIIGHHVPKGTYIFMAPWATNANKDLWGDDAEDFRPERWTNSSIDNNYAFMTFLHGPRSCIGQGFARDFLQYRYLLSTDFQRRKRDRRLPNGYKMKVSITVSSCSATHQQGNGLPEITGKSGHSETFKSRKRKSEVLDRMKSWFMKLFPFTKHKRTIRSTMDTDSTQSESVQEVQTGPPKNLGLAIAQYVEATEADRMAKEVYDFNGWAEKQLRIETVHASLLERRQPQPSPSMNIDWELLHKRLSSEEQDLDNYCRKRRGDWLKPPEKPDLSWFYEVGDAAAILKMQYEHVRDLTKSYAERKPTEQRNIDQLIQNCGLENASEIIVPGVEKSGMVLQR